MRRHKGAVSSEAEKLRTMSQKQEVRNTNHGKTQKNLSSQSTHT